MVSQRPFPKRWLLNGKKPILCMFLTELLIVMDLQDIPLKICFRVMNLNKYFGSSLLFNKSVKIQDGCQSNSIIPAAEFFFNVTLSIILCGYSHQIMVLIVKLGVTWPCQYHFLNINLYIMVSQTRNFYISSSNYHTCMVDVYFQCKQGELGRNRLPVSKAP